MQNKFFLFLLFSMVPFALIQGCGTDPGTDFSIFDAGNNTQIPLAQTSAVQRVKEENIYIYIYGEVAEPGIYVLPRGVRIYEVINKAGGVTDRADMSALDLVSMISEDAKIYVPNKNEASKSTTAKEEAYKKININTATDKELTALSGIGDSRAADIIRYREKNGGFKAIEEIMKVPGIKENIFERIKDNITVK